MAEERAARRKLAALLSADVVGYSRLMADDDRATLETLKRYREAIRRLVEKRDGRVVNAPGDALLAEFGSALEALEAENKRLRDLLGSAARVADRAVVAELVEVSLEPFTRKIVVAKGSRDSVYLGQPVIDAYGIIGQVTEVGPYASKATLITDPGHAIPVLVNRNGLRTIVFGTGAPDRVNVPYLTATADIREGDLLVSSGMGGRFPPGYPVAQVTAVVKDPNEAFLKISAKPMARLNYGKEVLLIWPGERRSAGASTR
jgi:rod shape-determining protein MreC